MPLYLLGISRKEDIPTTIGPINPILPMGPMGFMGPMAAATPWPFRWLPTGQLAAAVLPAPPPPSPRRHAALLAAIHREADVLPVRFGTTVENEHVLADLLGRRHAAWLFGLRRLAGAAEMGLRIELRSDGTRRVPPAFPLLSRCLASALAAR